jgi:hypothetical protein
MGLWRVPEKVLVPAMPDFSPNPFEFNGRLANGEQVMAYVGARTAQTHPPSSTPFTQYTAVVLRFNADGVLVTVDFATTAEGWVSADILIRPFYIHIDDLETGLLYQTDGEDESKEEEDFQDDSPERLTLVPFDIVFRRPWNTGTYDT